MAEANRGCGLHEESSLWVSRSMYSFQVCEVLESSYHHWTTVLVVLIGCSVPDKSGFSVLSQIPKKFRTSEKREGERQPRPQRTGVDTNIIKLLCYNI
ncbi:unnamed protein product [Dicrocoelium dendriticum]|nr:unnamed protein product [Dicrocoelium dendriticum]